MFITGEIRVKIYVRKVGEIGVKIYVRRVMKLRRKGVIILVGPRVSYRELEGEVTGI